MLTNRMRSLKSVDCLQMIYFMDLLFDLTSAVFVMAGAMLDLTKTLSNDAVWQCALDRRKWVFKAKLTTYLVEYYVGWNVYYSCAKFKLSGLPTSDLVPGFTFWTHINSVCHGRRHVGFDKDAQQCTHSYVKQLSRSSQPPKSKNKNKWVAYLPTSVRN